MIKHGPIPARDAEVLNIIVGGCVLVVSLVVAIPNFLDMSRLDIGLRRRTGECFSTAAALDLAQLAAEGAAKTVGAAG